MKIFIASIVSVVIVCALFFTLELTHNFDVVSNVASVLGSQQNTTYRACIREFSDQDYSSFTITKADINTDDKKDAIVQSTEESLCGTAGCITQLCVSTPQGEYAYIPFGYATKEIKIAETVTLLMHDLVLNNDENATMIWDGLQYQLSTN